MKIPNINDEIVILEEPKYWSDSGGGEYPLGLFFPICGRVTETGNGSQCRYMNVEIDSYIYGFALEFTKFDTLTL